MKSIDVQVCLHVEVLLATTSTGILALMLGFGGNILGTNPMNILHNDYNSDYYISAAARFAVATGNLS